MSSDNLPYGLSQHDIDRERERDVERCDECGKVRDVNEDSLCARCAHEDGDDIDD